MDDIVNTIGIVAVIVGLWLTWWTVRTDRQRVKRQATIEQWIAVAERRTELRDDLGPYRSTFSVLTLEDPFWLDESSDMRFAYSRMLGELERFAVGVNTDTFDLATLDRMSGVSIVRQVEGSRLYIANSRCRSPRVFGDLEQLATKLATRHELPFAPIEADATQQDRVNAMREAG